MRRSCRSVDRAPSRVLRFYFGPRTVPYRRDWLSDLSPATMTHDHSDMPLRLLLILLLLLNASVLPAVAGSDRVGECTSPCCNVVEMSPCCSSVTRSCCEGAEPEVRCRRADGDVCRCGLNPGDSESTERPLAPSDRSDTAQLLFALSSHVVERSRPTKSHATPTSNSIVRSHNEVRALLCIWRT